MTVAHQRARQGLESLLKKLKFSPVVSVQGPRQCGKSFLARVLLPKKLPDCEYHTLDRSDVREFARSNPRSFLEGKKGRHFIVDEAQKAPDLFDEIKAIVDEMRTPGQFLILGSTEFSIETKITESLTGRLSRLRLFPFNLSEVQKMISNNQKDFPFLQKSPRVSRKEFLRYLENGGLPGIFSVGKESEQTALFADWVKLTVERDIHQVPKLRLDSGVALKVLEQLALLATPSCIEVANALKISPKTVQKYLNVFKILFVIIEIQPTSYSSGKSLYFLTDVGICRFLGGNWQKKIQTWFYIELYSQLSYKDFLIQQIYYYRSPRGGMIHAIYESKNTLIAVKLNDSEKLDNREFLIFDGLKEKMPKNSKLSSYYLTGGLSYLHQNDIAIAPWESIV